LIVVDASILANVIGDDSVDGHRARSEVRAGGELAAPDLVDVETVAVLRKRWIAGSISHDRFAEAIDDLEAVELERYPTLPLMRRSYELRANVTAYDSTYVALAEVLGCELLTGDHPGEGGDPVRAVVGELGDTGRRVGDLGQVGHVVVAVEVIPPATSVTPRWPPPRTRRRRWRCGWLRPSDIYGSGAWPR
jgi:predicted nucleic acid-binding protein